MTDTPATRRKLPFWLAVSLMANMLLIGLLAGFFLRTAPPAPPAEAARFAWMPDDGEAVTIRRILREAFEASEAERAARAEARRALGEAVAKEPYDAEAVREAFRSVREADNAVNEAIHAAMVDLFATLPPEERGRIARLLTRTLPDRHSMRRPRLERGERGGAPGMGPDEGLPPLPPPPPPDEGP